MTGRGAVPDVPLAPPKASPSTPPRDASERAAAEEPGADGSDAEPAAPGDVSAASDAASDASSDAASSRSGEPPPDAATTFEDLPYDLFGEHEPENDAPPPVPADAEARAGEGRRPSAGAAPGAAFRDRPAQRPAPDETGDDAIEIVQTLFPGRIVAIESSPAPVAEEDALEATAAGAMTDSPNGVEDDDGERDEESGPRTTDDFASGTSG